jgi:hypothetical protein
MSMYDAIVALETTCTGQTGGPAVVQVTPQDMEDLRPGKNCSSWLNLTPVKTPRKDETGGSYIADYTIKMSLWIAKPVKTNAKAMLKFASDIWAVVITSIGTGHLGGYSRLDISPGQINDTWESGDDGDIAYVIRAEIVVQKQEA